MANCVADSHREFGKSSPTPQLLPFVFGSTVVLSCISVGKGQESKYVGDVYHIRLELSAADAWGAQGSAVHVCVRVCVCVCVSVSRGAGRASVEGGREEGGGIRVLHCAQHTR